MSEFEEFWVHEVTVTTLTGAGAWGDSYSDPVQVKGLVAEGNTLVRAADGNEVVSSTRFTTDTVGPDLFASGSQVTYRGKTLDVISVTVADSGPLGLPDHITVNLA
ncbi:hypothetical protein FBY30_2751 [Arthrobacter sp. SLBN-83]|uniref:hypothetical protein n=1 Tax=Arthrobacter sp. SLBN-83 TaxID=2768449 RepID=UPI001150AA48|nr:hypothetical protein [Arthrobacter sp. SLBN-83]TQJ60483.1 hypothetical protein FBY30_2751 [Arthrobacter sp. SLBN-83]